MTVGYLLAEVERLTAVIAAVRAEHSAVHDFSEDATRAVGPIYAARCRSCSWTMPCPTLKLLPPEEVQQS